MWELLMVALVGQIDPSLSRPLPGFDPAQWAPAPRISAPAVPAGPYEYTRVPDTTDFVAWAVLDLKMRQQTDPASIPYLRWIAIPEWGDSTWVEANSLVVNSACNQSSLIVLPEVLYGGRMIVWDLRKLAPKPDDLRRLLICWNALAIQEPYFHAEVPLSLGGSVASQPYVHIDGKTYHGRKFIPAPHVAQGYTLLEQETSCFAPLVRADDFLRRLSSTIEGGLYYHAIGFIRDGHRLDEREIFKLVGLDVFLSRKVEGDDRAAIFQSGVTGKPRTVEQVQGAVGRARITYDIFAEDVDASRHAIYNLVDGVDRARGKEIIFHRANGTLGYLLTDGAGKLVDVAPPNLVSDHRVPDPHEKQLYPMASCIRCHGPTGGVQAVRNEVPILLGGGIGELDLFDDLSSKDGRFATVDRVAGLYAAGDSFQQGLQESRDDYADAVFRATRGSGVRGAVGVVEKAHENFSKQFNDFWYAKSITEANVGADQACLELGYRSKAGEGRHVLNQLLPNRRIDVMIDGKPVTFVDPAIEGLKRGLRIPRKDWLRVYAAAAYGVSKEYKK
jgi:hypothetical protein